MRRTTKRATAAFRFEVLEHRTLLAAMTASVGVLNPLNPATTLLLKFAPGASAAATQAMYSVLGAHQDESFPNGPTVISLPAGADRASALARLKADPQVIYAEADETVHVADIFPNDPIFSAQWGLNNANNVDIDAPKAWGVTTGNPSTIVAIIDSGIDLSNPDFAARLWTNPVDGSHGWNFITGTSNVQDDNDHGTHVAGILAGTGNNNIGVAGVNWRAQIMALKFIDSTGSGSTDAAVSAIYYAVQHGARVINASWGGSEYSQALNDAISYAGSQGVVFVAAAGNNGTNNDAIPFYPADDRLPNEISVAAVDSNGALASFSNYGPSSVDLAAPGVNIWSTIPGSFAAYSGTSMATPFVAGVVSLVIGQNPNLTAAQAVHQVLSTVKPLPSLAGITVTGGMVDAYNAVALQSVQSVATLAQGIPKTDLSVYRWQQADWLSLDPSTGSVTTVQFGQAGVDIPVSADYYGTGRLDYAVYRPTTGQWFIWGPSGPRVVQFGAPGLDIPVPADYDGTGKADIAVYRPTTGTWYILGASGGRIIQFGAPMLDQPVPADYDGDGRVDIAVYRPTTSQWFIDRSTLGPIIEQFGVPGLSIPVPGNYGGDLQADLAYYEPSLALWSVVRAGIGVQTQALGPIGLTIPIPGEYDTSGTTDPGVFRFDTAQWFITRADGSSFVQQFGAGGYDMPITTTINFRLLVSSVPLGGGTYHAAAPPPPPHSAAHAFVSGAAAATVPVGVPETIAPVAITPVAALALPSQPALPIGVSTQRANRRRDAALESAFDLLWSLRWGGSELS